MSPLFSPDIGYSTDPTTIDSTHSNETSPTTCSIIGTNPSKPASPFDDLRSLHYKLTKSIAADQQSPFDWSDCLNIQDPFCRGSGSSGDVYRGRFLDRFGELPLVAVKIIKPIAQDQELPQVQEVKKVRDTRYPMRCISSIRTFSDLAKRDCCLAKAETRKYCAIHRHFEVVWNHGIADLAMDGEWYAHSTSFVHLATHPCQAPYLNTSSSIQRQTVPSSSSS